jgi:O-antigen/teichoic acid export membrane protein
MGKLGIASSLANYFVVGAMLGLPVYGVREIARNARRGDDLDRTATELFVLGVVSSIVSTLVYIVVIVAVPRYREDLALFLVFGSTILTSSLGIEWFFQGVEKFRFIGLRNVAIKACFIVALFLLVGKPGDYIRYALLFAVASLASAVVNLLTARRYVRPGLAGARPGRHMGPMFVFAVFSLAITAYTNLDFLFLGLFSTDSEAGLYSIAIRLVRMVVTVSATLSAVLLPRLSATIGDESEEYARIIKASAAVTALFALPAGAGLLATADDLARAFAGRAFLGAAGSLRITAFIVPVVAASNFLQMQILVPRRREKATLFSFAAGFVVAAVTLALLVKPYGHIGAAWGMLAGEVVVLAVQIALCGREILASLVDSRALLVYFVGSVLCGAAALVPRLFMSEGIGRLCVSVVFGALVYLFFLLAVKDERAVGMMRKFRKGSHA